MRPVGVGETRRRLFDKIVLKSTCRESTVVCQDDKLCAKLKAVINGAVHRFQAICDEKPAIEDWGFLLVDAKNAFNDIN